MLDEPAMDGAQREQFLRIVVAETERLSRLVNQVLDLAKIESGHAQWHDEVIDPIGLLRQAARHGAPNWSASAAPSCGSSCRRARRRCAPTATGCCRC